MTGREFIVYILENHLENEDIFQNGELIGYMSEVRAAIKFEVGLATIRAWIESGKLDHIKIGDVYFISQNAKDPKA